MIGTVISVVLWLLAIYLAVVFLWLIAKQFYDIAKYKLASSNYVYIPKATIAVTLGKLARVNEGSRIYILGYDLRNFFDPTYMPLFKLLMVWVSRKQAQIVYFLHKYPLDDEQRLSKLQEKLNKPVFNKSSGGLQFRLLKSNARTSELIAATKTNHFLLIAPPIAPEVKPRKGNHSIWLEANHPEGKTYALGCEYVINADKEEQLPQIKKYFNLMLANSSVIAQSESASTAGDLRLSHA